MAARDVMWIIDILLLHWALSVDLAIFVLLGVVLAIVYGVALIFKWGERK